MKTVEEILIDNVGTIRLKEMEQVTINEVLSAMEAYADQFRGGRIVEHHQQALWTDFTLLNKLLYDEMNKRYDAGERKFDFTVTIDIEREPVKGYRFIINRPQLSHETN